MKKLIAGIILMSLLFTSLSFFNANALTPEDMLSKGISPMSGTFIQPWLYNTYTDEMWDNEMTDWKNMGIEYLIMGDVIWFDHQNDFKIEAAYPSEMENMTFKKDDVTKLYEKCKKHGIKLYIGIGNSKNGWDFLDFNKDSNIEVFKTICSHFANVAEELYNLYYEDYKDVFAGFYFVPELYNSSAFDNEAMRTKYVNAMAGGFNIVLDKITSLNEELPLIFSPYVNIFGGSWVSKSYDNIEAFWTEFIQTANFRTGDILCPQDSVGAGGMDLEKLDDMTRAYKNAVTNSGKGLKLWSNCEIFVQPKDPFYSLNDEFNYWNSGTIGRMIRQFEIVSKYTERIFTFAYPHYLSRYNAAEGFYNTYMDYLETGVLESNAPTPPDKFRTYIQQQNGKSILYIAWSGMYDNFGISQVNVYKNGELMTYRIPYRVEGSAKTLMYPNSCYDAEYDFDTDESVVYEFEVIDCAGNISERSVLTVEPGSVPNNVRLDAAYKGPVESSEEPSTEESSENNSLPEETSSPETGNGGKLWLYVLAVTGAAAATAGIAFGLIKLFKKKK